MPPVIQATNNILVVDTGRERILVDTGFGEKIGPPFGSFPGLEPRADAGGGLRPGRKTHQRASCIRIEPISFYVYVKRDSATAG
jgi:hypothetical protein